MVNFSLFFENMMDFPSDGLIFLRDKQTNNLFYVEFITSGAFIGGKDSDISVSAIPFDEMKKMRTNFLHKKLSSESGRVNYNSLVLLNLGVISNPKPLFIELTIWSMGNTKEYTKKEFYAKYEPIVYTFDDAIRLFNKPSSTQKQSTKKTKKYNAYTKRSGVVIIYEIFFLLQPYFINYKDKYFSSVQLKSDFSEKLEPYLDRINNTSHYDTIFKNIINQWNNFGLITPLRPITVNQNEIYFKITSKGEQLKVDDLPPEIQVDVMNSVF